MENTRVCGAVRRARPISNPRYPESTAASRSVGGGARRRSRSCTSRGDAPRANLAHEHEHDVGHALRLRDGGASRRAGGRVARGTRARVAGVAPARGPRRSGLPARRARRALAARADAAAEDSSASSASKDETRISVDDVLRDSTALPANFCIIEGGARDKVRDFADLSIDELLSNIESRKNKVFIMLGEVRRLRVQVQLKNKTEEVRNTFGFEPATRAAAASLVETGRVRAPPVPADVSRETSSAHTLPALFPFPRLTRNFSRPFASTPRWFPASPASPRTRSTITTSAGGRAWPLCSSSGV